jgi:formylglycine-generating enzyme required for sulfatase activity
MYPVVGVSWEQATDYCVWRSDRVNEKVLKENGVIDFPDFEAIYRDSTRFENDSTAKAKAFNTGKYLKTDDYDPASAKTTSVNAFGDPRKTNMSDGLLMPNYRLPTEAEWEFAAYGLKSEEDMENYDVRRIYPWDGTQTRNPNRKHRGKIMANFSRGRGDMMGVAGDLNDKANITAPVNSFWPNDFGLYNMAGNVNEWVMDVYRPASSDEYSEYNPFRGNVYVAPVQDSIGNFQLDSLGRLAYDVPVSRDSLAQYNKYDVRNWKDGDAQSGVNKWTDVVDPDVATRRLYDADFANSDMEKLLATQISNTTRVYKGGSWKDRSYWLSPATRRYKEQSKSANDIGFRCAMDRVGSDKGNNSKK